MRLARPLGRQLGRTAGRLFALSTAGSIAGTFATAFWLVPELGTDQLLAFGAVALLVAALVVAARERLPAARRSPPRAPSRPRSPSASRARARPGGHALGGAPRNWSPLYRRARRGRRRTTADTWVDSTINVLLDREDTRYHHVFVVDDADTRYLRFDSLVPERHVR